MLNALAKATRVIRVVELVSYLGYTAKAIHNEIRPPAHPVDLSKREIVILRLALLRSIEYLKAKPECAGEHSECSNLSAKLWRYYDKFDK